jgi:Pyruvate/2-oxoacid:ferredoxin oxidoreductase delta subunit
MRRNIVRIDEARCNGCGLCVTACAEGAIQLVEGKARLVKDQYCDGLGACLGECPQGAITIEQREAGAFDEAAAQKHVASTGPVHAPGAAHRPVPATPAPHKHAAGGCPGAAAMSLGGGCPGSATRSLGAVAATSAAQAASGQTPSSLRNWPVQLKLVSPMAPYLDGARLCIAADCTAFACPDFHAGLLSGKMLMIGCPKLDETGPYMEKLATIFKHNDIPSVEVVYMEVPCCFGLAHLVRQAIEQSGKAIPLTLTKVGIEGGVVERLEL